MPAGRMSIARAKRLVHVAPLISTPLPTLKKQASLTAVRMAAAPAKQGLKALLIRGWNELPDIVGGTVLALIGVGFGAVGLANFYRKDGENKRYKYTYVVFRDDDPRAARVRKD